MRRLCGHAMRAGLLVTTLWLVGCEPEGGKPELLCYVGGTMRPALEVLAKQWEAKTGQKVLIDYADSGSLLIKIENTKKGDLYVCHDPFAGALNKKGLDGKVWAIAALTPMIAVPKGNPKTIADVRDLVKPEIRVGLTDAEYSTLGHICPVMFKKAGILDAMTAKEKDGKNLTRSRMGGQMANGVIVGSLDAAIVWDAVIGTPKRREKLDAVDIGKGYRPHPETDAVTTATYGVIDMSSIKVTIATLKCSKQTEAATKFAEYVAGPEARKVFDEFGYTPIAAGAAPEPTTATAPATTEKATP